MSGTRKAGSIVGGAVRLLFMGALLASLSPLQLAWASISCLCQSLERAESCGCAHGCDPAMHEESEDPAPHRRSGATSSIDKGSLPGAQHMACCGSQQQSDKPAVTFTSPPTVEVEESPSVALPGRLATAQAMRTHDPPRSRPLYVTNSCLLI